MAPGAVLKQEFNWSTFQDAQLDALRSIQNSLASTVITSKLVERNLTDLSKSMTILVGATKSIAESLNTRTNAERRGAEAAGIFTGSIATATNTLDKLTGSQKKQLLVVDEFNEVTEYFTKKEEEAAAAAEELVKSIQETLDQQQKEREAAREREEFLAKQDAVLKDILSTATQKMTELGRAADKFSTVSNQMIALTGMRGSDVSSFRTELMGTVAKLNLETGSAFGPQQSYQNVVAISQGVTSNLEAIQEMARPLLLSQETLDASTQEIAELFNKYYTRYTFSSLHMENSLDEIRSNTAGNSASAEATLENIASLETWIAYSAGNDNAKREELLKEISHYTSWLESMDLDSAPFTEYLNNIAYGDFSSNPELVNILTRAGVSTIQSQEMMWDGQYEELTKALIKGIYSSVDTIDGSYAMGPSLDNIGIERLLGMDVFNLMKSDGYVEFDEFLSNNSKYNVKMTELVEDKYVSATDKINNWLEQIYKVLADGQEMVGFGLSDIANLIILGMGIKQGADLIGNIGEAGGPKALGQKALGNIGKIFGKGTPGAVTSTTPGTTATATATAAGGAAGLGTTLAAAAISAGIIAGGATLATDGIKDLVDKDNDDLTKALSGGQAAAGIGAIASLLSGGILSIPLLAIGGVLFLTKKIHENATELTGNAKLAEQSFDKIKDTLETENLERLNSLGELKASLKDAESLDEKLKLVKESHLVNEETLAGMSEENLTKLVDAYADSAMKINSITESLISGRKGEVAQEQHDQQKALMETMREQIKSGELSGSDLENAMAMLMSGVTDEKLLKKYEKKKKNGLTNAEAKDLLDGGWFVSQWFDKNNLTDKAVDVSAMQNVDALFGFTGTEYSIFDQSKEAAMAALMANLATKYNAYALADPTVQDALKADLISFIDGSVRKSDYLEDLKKSSQYGSYLEQVADNLGIEAFAEGTNYVNSTKLALLHEGEAVVPKRYNPAANTDELKSSFSSQLREVETSNKESREHFIALIEEIKEIKEFLNEWKVENARREDLSEINSPHQTSRTAIQRYLVY